MKKLFNNIRKLFFGINILDLYDNGSEMLDMNGVNQEIMINPIIKVMGQNVQVVKTLGHVKPIMGVILLNGEKRMIIDKTFYQFSIPIQKFFINHELGHFNDPNFKINGETKPTLVLNSLLEITADNYSFKNLTKKELKEVYNKIFKPLYSFYRDELNNLMESGNLTEEEKTSVKLENEIITDRYNNILKYL